jgi:hypothetical protein
MSGELAADHVKLVKAMMRSLNPEVQFSTSRAKTGDLKRKPKVADLNMNAKVILTEEAEKARVGTAFQDRKKIYTKHNGKTVEELVKLAIKYTSKGKELRFGKKELMMDSSLMKKKPFIKFITNGEEEESEGEASGSGSEAEVDF